MYLSKQRQKYLKEFRESHIFKINFEESSNYWKFYSESMSLDFNKKNEIISGGGTGGSRLYQNKFKVFLNTLFKLVNDKKPKLIFKRLKKFIFSRSKRFLNSFKIRQLSLRDGFDAVMNHDPIIKPHISPYRVNHLELKKYKGVFKSYKEIYKHYAQLSRMKMDGKVVMHYYNYNLLQPYIKSNENQIFLDIGGGNGLLASLITQTYKPKTFFMIDLPSTLMNAFCYLYNCDLKINITLPHSITSNIDIEKIINRKKDNYTNFIFLTPSQANLINSNTVDLSINTTSFQEMTSEQINFYFNLIERISKNNSLFYCVNRIEKIPQEIMNNESCKPNLFYEYPWKQGNERLINETSRLSTACQYESVAIRLERVKK